jgi:diguanylate cyclase (GGDEF)-like protein
MPDNDTPHNDNDHKPAPASPAATSGSQGASQANEGARAADGDDSGIAPTDRASSDAARSGIAAPVGRASSSSRAVWAATATVCAVLGILASVLGAQVAASNDAAGARRAAAQNATSIASTLKVAIRHEEQLTVSASTYFGSHPKATTAEFAAWVKWARAHSRYPELDALGFLAPTQASPALLISRDTASSIYTTVPSGIGQALAIETPVYRGTITPRSVAGRRAASVGWLREVLIPSVVLSEALTGQAGYAARLRHPAAPASLVFASGQTQAWGQSTVTHLSGGWTAEVSTPAIATGVFADGRALGLLIGGCLLSVLIGVLVYLLGMRGTQTSAPPAVREIPHEDLYDQLTGLPNRALMIDRAERILARTGRQSEMVAGALSIEIDWLKNVNDKLGRDAGDRLLQAVAQRLERVIRTGDTVGRIGGDEFIVLVESSARGIRLDSLARRILEALHEPVELEGFGPSFVLTASIGVAFGRYTTPEDLLRDAHAAAQTAGRDRYTLFNANMRSVIESHGVLEAELSTALAEHQFFLLYQPIRELSSQRIVGVESLIRWRHPTRGVLSPADFLSVAEDTGLIVPIGRWVLEEACARGAAWGVAGRRVGVSVSVAAGQLSREGFVTDVRRALQQSGIEPAQLTLEIPAAAVLPNLAVAAERMTALKQLGVRIALDDFGGGYTSQADLRRLQLDFLKVDRSTLASSDTEEYRSWLLETILVAGRDLSLIVIAKGIENADQMQTLQQKGCRLAQGIFLGEPDTAEAIAKLFATPAGAPDQSAATPSPGPVGSSI